MKNWRYYSYSIPRTQKFLLKKQKKNQKKINVIKYKDKSLKKYLSLLLRLI